jgi:hypothetical protein
LITSFCTRRHWFVACAWALFVVMVGAHSLSFVHRIAHAHAHAHAHGSGHASATIAADDNHFSHDEGSASCLAFDATLSLTQCAPPATLAVNVVLYGATSIVSPPTRTHAAQPRAAANARAPPGESSPQV